MLRTLSQLKDIRGKRVLVRVDFNVPISRGRVSDTTRIRETLPTIRFFMQKKARIIIVTHLGRPEGRTVPALRLRPVASALEKLIKKHIPVAPGCVGPKISSQIARMKEGDIVMLENIRFCKGEEDNDPVFVRRLAELGDIFVNDAFAVSHREHASVCGIAKKLPSYAGFLMQAEIEYLSPLLKKTKRPLLLIIGGVKIDTKIGLLKNFLSKADTILVGGALANTFLLAQGYDVGASLFKEDKIETAREILSAAEKQGCKIVLPHDVVVADAATEGAATVNLPVEDVEGTMKILDIGDMTRKNYRTWIAKAKTIIWNGPMGLYEIKSFREGSRAVAQAVANNKGTTIIGGGDTIDAIAQLKLPTKKFTFISTGGGAMLEFLEGRLLPGVQVLLR